MNAKVPSYWKRVHLSSDKLADWVRKVIKNVKFFCDWIEGGQPKVFWLPAFWNPIGLITAIKIRYSRIKVCPIENMQFDVKFSKSEGIGIEGLYLENAEWDTTKEVLTETRHKINHSFPIVSFVE